MFCDGSLQGRAAPTAGAGNAQLQANLIPVTGMLQPSNHHHSNYAWCAGSVLQVTYAVSLASSPVSHV